MLIQIITQLNKELINQIDRNVNLGTITDFARLERTKYLVHPTKSVVLGGGFTIQTTAYNLFNYASIGNIYGSTSNVIDADVTP